MRLGIFVQTLGGLEVVLGDRITKLTRDLFQRELTPAQEEAQIEQTGIALENIRRQEEALEEEATSLVAYGDYILQQVQAAREMSRRITSQDIERYVIEFFARNYPGCHFQQQGEDPALVDVELSSKAKNDLATFLREARARTVTALTRADPAPVRCRFENRLRTATRRNEELITQLHPVVRFVGRQTEERKLVLYPAIAARITRSLLPKAFPIGDYRIAITRWTFEALRTTERLWYGAERIDPGGNPLDDEDAERFVMSVAENGEDWPAAAAELDLERQADEIEQGLLVRGRARFEQHAREVIAQNDDRAVAQLRSLDNHLTHQERRHQDLRRKHEERGYAGLARAEERNIERLRARVDRQRLALDEKRRLRHSMEELCVGIVRVSA
jgi:hypothetical protein